MDKRVIFAVAGAGKTTYIVNRLSQQKRSLIITYTENNFYNLQNRILKKYDGEWPENVMLMTYFSFLFKFCYRPFLSNWINAKGFCFDKNPNRFNRQESQSYFMTSSRYIYHNRLALLIEKNNILGEVKARLERYFDEFIIDEIQDIAGRDFNFLEQLMDARVDMLFVGDFFQHTYDTSRDGNVNGSLFDDIEQYEKRFSNRDFVVDKTSLQKSWRCGKAICEFVRENLGINIYSNVEEKDCKIEYVTLLDRINDIMENKSIIKLHYQKSSQFGIDHKNWGDTKGEDKYNDVCVMLNKSTAEKYKKGTMDKLANLTRNKLYVAITRARGNVFLINEQ